MSNFRCAEEDCRAQFLTIHDLEAHIRHLHFHYLPFECPICQKCLPTEKRFAEHWLKTHSLTAAASEARPILHFDETKHQRVTLMLMQSSTPELAAESNRRIGFNEPIPLQNIERQIFKAELDNYSIGPSSVEEPRIEDANRLKLEDLGNQPIGMNYYRALDTDHWRTPTQRSGAAGYVDGHDSRTKTLRAELRAKRIASANNSASIGNASMKVRKVNKSVTMNQTDPLVALSTTPSTSSTEPQFSHSMIDANRSSMSLGQSSTTFAGHSVSPLDDLIATDQVNRPFKCDKCDWGFANKHSLKQHQSVHSIIKPYKCELCLKAFGQRGVLDRHRRTHTGERPHRCEHCGRTFIRRYLMIKHMREHFPLPVNISFDAMPRHPDQPNL